MLTRIMNLVDKNRNFILDGKNLGELVDFLNGFAVSPKNNTLISFNRKQFCLDVSEGKDSSWDIMSVLLSKSQNRFEAYDLFYRYMSDKYECVEKREASLDINLQGIYKPPICYAMATLYKIPKFVLDDVCLTSMIAFLYGYHFGVEAGKMPKLSETNLEKILQEIRGRMKQIDLLINTQLSGKMQWNDFFLKYSVNLEKIQGKSLEQIFNEKNRESSIRRNFW